MKLLKIRGSALRLCVHQLTLVTAMCQQESYREPGDADRQVEAQGSSVAPQGSLEPAAFSAGLDRLARDSDGNALSSSGKSSRLLTLLTADRLTVFSSPSAISTLRRQ